MAAKKCSFRDFVNISGYVISVTGFFLVLAGAHKADAYQATKKSFDVKNDSKKECVAEQGADAQSSNTLLLPIGLLTAGVGVLMVRRTR